MILSGAAGNTATLRVVTPEPSSLVLLILSSLALAGGFYWKFKTIGGLWRTL